jgi:hypothetical protein
LLISAHDIHAMPLTVQPAVNRVISILIHSNIFGGTATIIAGILNTGPGTATICASMAKIVVVTLSWACLRAVSASWSFQRNSETAGYQFDPHIRPLLHA